jgi:hypothetical protein
MEMISRGMAEAERQASVLCLQRERQQGKGRPIIAAKNGEHWVVVVGRRICKGPWKTFPDFLLDYVRWTLGEAWGQAEIGKPEAEKHPIIRWYQALCLVQAKHIHTPGEVSSMPKYGVVSAYLGLAYDLYTLEHNEDSTPGPAIRDRLLNRLRHPDQFVGARYEIRVAAMFLRAGFRLVWEDESVGNVTHGEFTATFPETGRSFWVECKIRQRSTGLSQERLGKFIGLVSDALRKTTDQERFVFVDLNTPAQPVLNRDQPDWRDWAVGRLRMLEGSPAGRTLPRAFVMVTNYPDHHHLDALVPDAGGAIEGFKMDDYRAGAKMTLREAIARRDRNIEIEALLHSMAEHHDIPSTFDGTIPGIDGAADRLIIGRRYEIAPGSSGVLVEACVAEDQKKVAMILRREDGSQVLAECPLSDVELEAWRHYPETFFGVMRDPQQGVSSVLDLYDFFLRSYLQSSKEALLEQMGQSHDVSHLADLSQEQVASFYAERTAEAALSHTGGFPIPTWVERLRPPPSSDAWSE